VPRRRKRLGQIGNVADDLGLLPKGSLAATAGSIRLVGEELLTASEPAPAAVARHHHGNDLSGADDGAQSGGGRSAARLTRCCARIPTLDARARRKRILDMMDHVRLPEVERIFASYPHRLSGGQRQAHS